MTALYYGGVEGGATHSKTVICDSNGSIISKVVGLGTNHWVIGIPEVARRIADMVDRAKTQANIEDSTKLRSLGLSLSGCEQDSTNKDLENQLIKHHPHISESYYVCSDTLGSIFTASPLGGLVLIAGTGSNGLLRNPDGKMYGCGGWGYVLGDEGSAFSIAHKAIKTHVDSEDKLVYCPYNTMAVWEQVKKHFTVKTPHDLFEHYYANFDKAFFASFCIELADLANAGDALSLHLFEEAGRYLAKFTLALLPKVSDELLVDGNLNIVCVGSVWKSWHLLKAGFSKELATVDYAFGLNLLNLTQAMAIGAAYLAADSINFNLPRNYSNNYEIFQHFPKCSTATVKSPLANSTNCAKKHQCNGCMSNETTSNGMTTNGHIINGFAKKKTNGITNGLSEISIQDR